MKAVRNPYSPTSLTQETLQASFNKALTQGGDERTLAGGKAGHGPGGAASAQPHSASSAVQDLHLGESFSIALDALSVMFEGVLESDRERLDRGFEDLVGELEGWRDAVPKA